MALTDNNSPDEAAPLTLVGCGILEKEIKHLVEKNEWPLATRFLCSSLHVDFDKLAESLTGSLAKLPPDRTITFYGTCHPRMAAILRENHSIRTRGQNCVEILLGKEVFTRELGQGAFFLMEDWARNWETITTKAFGPHPEVRNEIFREEHKYFLAIRTPLSADFSAEAEAISSEVGLPLKWMDVGLEFLEEALSEALNKQIDSQPAAGKREPEMSALAQEKANLQIIVDLFSELATVSGLDQTVQRVLEQLMNSIGGSNIVLYYGDDDGYVQTDIYGTRKEVDRIDDPLVEKAISTRSFCKEDGQDPMTTGSVPDIFEGGTTWVFPLSIGTELIGALKIEGIIISYPEAVRVQLESFVTYISLILKNEMSSSSRLGEAYDQLQAEHERLRRQTIDREAAEEENRELQQKLADAGRRESLGVLAGGIAHDFNNILGPIVMLPDMINEVLEDLDHASTDEIAEAMRSLDVIQDSAGRASDVIKDLTVLGRRGHAGLRTLDMNRVVTRCLATHDVTSLHKDNPNIKIDCRLHDGAMLVSGDKTDLHRVLLNLVVNAVEAISGQGSVLVETELVSLAEQKLCYEAIAPGEYVVVRVRDTGEGIPDHMLRRIFEPFATSKKESGGKSGSGLGLSVVYSIMKDHQGCVDVERNRKEWSTTFSLYFPVSTADREGEADAQDVAMPSGAEHILVVDDEPGFRFTVSKSLRKLGYTVTEAANGVEAVALFKKATTAEVRDGETRSASEPPFDLVLLDMIMGGGIDGLDAFKAMEELYPDVKVIVSSGHAKSERISDAQQMGAGWLEKPYKAQVLALAVREKLDEKSSS